MSAELQCHSERSRGISHKDKGYVRHLRASTARPYNRLTEKHPVGACIARPPSPQVTEDWNRDIAGNIRSLHPSGWHCHQAWRDMAVFSKYSVPSPVMPAACHPLHRRGHIQKTKPPAFAGGFSSFFVFIDHYALFLHRAAAYKTPIDKSRQYCYTQRVKINRKTSIYL